MNSDLGQGWTRGPLGLVTRRRVVHGAAATVAGSVLRLASDGGSVSAAKRKRAGVCAGGDDGAAGGDNGTTHVQTFTASRTGKLSQIAIVTENSPGNFGDFIIRLFAVDGAGVPVEGVAGVLTEVTIPFAKIPLGDPVTVRANFGKNRTVKLVKGTEYGVAVTRSAGDTYLWHTRSAGGCGGQLFFSLGQFGPFSEDAGSEEALFTVFVTV